MTSSATHRLSAVLGMMDDRECDIAVYPSTFVPSDLVRHFPVAEERPPVLCISCGLDTGKRKRSAQYCPPCMRRRQIESARRWQDTHPLGLKAHGLVLQAIKFGFLKPLSELSCVDCGEPAKHYDHRDYRRPLDVEPTCVSCNKLRGPAKPYLKG